jgi:DNA polymerase-3 subunit delta'
MASVRLLQRRSALTSVEGGRRIFIVGEADRLVPQESSPEAANALLKLLEEPPGGALFVLTTHDPRRVLPTIRSRAVPVRLHRLSDEEVRTFLRGSLELSPSELDERVRLAEGSIGLALAVGERTGDALADTLGEAARGALGQPVRRPLPAALTRAARPEPLLRALERVAEAREAAAGNVNPQLLLAVLGAELAEVL